MLAALRSPPLTPASTRMATDCLRLALVTETFPPEVNGVAMTLGRLAHGLRQRGHAVEIVRPRLPEPYPNGCALPGHDHRRDTLRPAVQLPNYPELRIGVPSFTTLRARWRRSRPDVVHVATEGPLGLSALLAARSLRIPCTSTFHTNFDQYADHYRIGLFRQAIAGYLKAVHLRTACTMVPTVKQAADLRRQGYRNVVVLSRGLDGQLFHPTRRSESLRRSWGVEPEDLVFTTVGRVAPEKNLELSVRALQAVRERHPRARLVIVGDGPDRARFEGSPGVIMAGMRCDTDLAAHYASADIFLFPSMTETFGNVLCEAMASGLACLGYAYAAADEVVREGENGLTAAFGDADAFLVQAQRLADDAGLRRRLGPAAGELGKHRDWNAVTAVFEHHLHRAVAR
jgi:glycosyltransferase involved in cell wall biosynthesis